MRLVIVFLGLLLIGCTVLFMGVRSIREVIEVAIELNSKYKNQLHKLTLDILAYWQDYFNTLATNSERERGIRSKEYWREEYKSNARLVFPLLQDKPTDSEEIKRERANLREARVNCYITVFGTQKD